MKHISKKENTRLFLLLFSSLEGKPFVMILSFLSSFILFQKVFFLLEKRDFLLLIHLKVSHASWKERIKKESKRIKMCRWKPSLSLCLSLFLSLSFSLLVSLSVQLYVKKELEKEQKKVGEK